MSDSRTPQLEDVILGALRNNRQSMFGGWLPGRIESYDDAKQKANIELCIGEAFDDDGTPAVRKYPALVDVPVVFSGSGGRRIKFPVAVGDSVLVIFAARSVDRWLARGGRNVDPGDQRDHDLSDAVAIPGLMDFAHVDDASTMIDITASEIRLGAGATSAVALKSDLDALKSAINSWTPVAMDGGAALKAALTALFATWPVCATKAKAE